MDAGHIIGDGAVAPGVVPVLHHDLAGAGLGQRNHVALQVVHVVVQDTAAEYRHPRTRAVVEEPHHTVAGLLRQDLGTVEEVFSCRAVDGFGRADAVGVILVAIRVAAALDRLELPALPCVGAAVVGRHVAHAVVGDGMTVVSRQQVLPGAVVVAEGPGLFRCAGGVVVGILLYGLDIARVVVGVDKRGALGLAVVADELVLPVVGGGMSLRGPQARGNPLPKTRREGFPRRFAPRNDRRFIAGREG